MEAIFFKAAGSNLTSVLFYAIANSRTDNFNRRLITEKFNNPRLPARKEGVMLVICWVPNGFREGNPNDVDMFSHASLLKAVCLYRAAENYGGRLCCLLILNPVPRDTTRKVFLRDTMHAVAVTMCKNIGIQNPDIRLTPRETTGSPTDGLALSEFVKANLGADVVVCACTRESAEYFSVMYAAVAQYILGFELRAEFVWPASARPDFKSRYLYRAMRLVTVVAAVSRPTFMLLYNLLNRLYEGRRTGFKTTIS